MKLDSDAYNKISEVTKKDIGLTQFSFKFPHRRDLNYGLYQNPLKFEKKSMNDGGVVYVYKFPDNIENFEVSVRENNTF